MFLLISRLASAVCKSVGKPAWRQLTVLCILLTSVVLSYGQTITTISPRRAQIGSVVTISGTNFSGATAVTIGGTAATMVSNTATTIQVVVMPGTNSGPVVVTTGSGTATSAAPLGINPTGTPQAPQGNTLNPALGSGALTGSAIALSADGNTMAVGAPGAAGGAGNVAIYTRDLNLPTPVWSLQTTLSSFSGISGAANAGTRVALSASGDVVAVSGTADNGNTGAVWIFTRSGNAWSAQGGKLVPAVGDGASIGSNYLFGSSLWLSADGSRLYAGAPGDNSNRGAVWQYLRSGSTWSVQGSKLAPAVGGAITTTAQQFGTAIALSANQNTLAVGAVGDSTSRGLVWVYSGSHTAWTQQAVLRGRIGGAVLGANALFGTSLSLTPNGNRLVVGAPGHNSNDGATHILSRSGSTWTQDTVFVSSGASRAGSIVTISPTGDHVFSMAPNTLFSTFANHGFIIQYIFNAGSWTGQFGFQNPVSTGAANSFLGRGMAVSADYLTMAVGAPGVSTNQGVVYPFALSGPSRWAGGGVPFFQGRTGYGQFGGGEQVIIRPSYISSDVPYTQITYAPAQLPPGMTGNLDGQFFAPQGTPGVWQNRLYTITAQGAYGLASIPLTLGVGIDAPGIYYPANANRFTFSTGVNSIIPAPFRRANTGALPLPVIGTYTPAGLAGTLGNADGTGSAARFNAPAGVVVDRRGRTYVADQNNHVIRRFGLDGAVTVFAGTAGSSGTTDGLGAAARFNSPRGLTIDTAGNIYVADAGNHRIRRIDTLGNVMTLAGSSAGFVDNATGTSARFNNPTAVAASMTGDLYVADSANHSIRRIDLATGAVTTYAGTGSVGTNNGTRTAATFNSPTGVAVDPAGSVYVADRGNQVIRRIHPQTGTVTLFSGALGTTGFTNGDSLVARYNNPAAITTDSLGNIYIADAGNHAIRRIQVTISVDNNTGLTNQVVQVSTLAGTGTAGSNNSINLAAATFNMPMAVAVDNDYSVVVADWHNHTVRLLAQYGFSISPALPAGLAFGRGGQIQGAATALSPVQQYTVTATNIGGSSTTTMWLGVRPGPTVTATAPNRVVAGTLLTVTGTNLDGVVRASINGTPAIITSRGSTTLKMVVNEGTTTGVLRLFRTNDSADTRIIYISQNTNVPLRVQGNAAPRVVATGPPSPSLTDQRFGAAVAISADGNTAAIGAPADDDHKGRTYVFTRTDTVWSTTTAQLVGTSALGVGSAARQGSALAMNAEGTLLAVGAPLDGVQAISGNSPVNNGFAFRATGVGAVWVFSRAANGANTWSQQIKLSPGGTDTLGFGNDISMSADGLTLAVGTLRMTNSAGGIYIYRYNGASWLLDERLPIQATMVRLSANGNTLAYSDGSNMRSLFYDFGVWNTGVRAGGFTMVVPSASGQAFATANASTFGYDNADPRYADWRNPNTAQLGSAGTLAANADGTLALVSNPTAISSVPGSFLAPAGTIGGVRVTGNTPSAAGSNTTAYGGSGTTVPFYFGAAMAMSLDGTTAVVGAPGVAGWATSGGQFKSEGSAVFLSAGNPSMKYLGVPRWYARNAVMDTLLPTVNGSVPAYDIINGATLPAGMVFDNTTGNIVGEPTADQAITTYIIEGRGPTGRARDTIQFGVREFYGRLGYPMNRLILRKGVPMPTLTPIVEGSDPASWSLRGTLPAGISFNNTTGVLSGTPTQNEIARDLWIRATTASGFVDSFSLILEVNDTLRHSYNPITIVPGTNSITASPILSGIGTHYPQVFGVGTLYQNFAATGIAFDPQLGRVALVNNTELRVRDSLNTTNLIAHTGSRYARARDVAFLRTRYQGTSPAAPVLQPIVLTTNETGGLGNAVFYTTSPAPGAIDRKLADLPVRGRSLAVDAATQTVYVATIDHRILRITAPSALDANFQPFYRAPQTFVGSTASQTGNTDGNGTAARFNTITDITVDGDGNLYVADQANRVIRKVTPAGVVSTYIGNGNAASVDGTGSVVSFNSPTAVAVDGAGNLYVGDGVFVRRIQGNTAITIDTMSAPITDLAVQRNNQLLIATTANVQQINLFGALRRVPPPMVNGLTFDDNTLVYSGVPTGRDIVFPDTTRNFQTVLLQPFSADTAIFTLTYSRLPAIGLRYTPYERFIKVGDAVQFTPSWQFIPTRDNTITYSATGMPSFLTLNTTTGVITGTANAALARTTFQVQGTNGVGLPEVVTVAITVGNAPDISYTRNVVIRRNVAVPAGTMVPANAGGAVPNGYINSLVASYGDAVNYSGGTVNGTGAAVRFAQPKGLAIDAQQNVYVAQNGAIRMITPAGVVSTAFSSFPNNDGPIWVAIDANGTFYYASNSAVYVYNTGSATWTQIFNTVNIITSSGSAPWPIHGLIALPNGNLMVSNEIDTREITPTGSLVQLYPRRRGKVALDFWGNMWQTSTGNINNWNGISWQTDNNVYVQEYKPNGITRATLTGTGGCLPGSPGFATPLGIAHTYDEMMYIVESDANRIRSVNVSPNGTYCVNPGVITLPASVSTTWPVDIVADNSGNLFISQYLNVVSKFSRNGWLMGNALPSGLTLQNNGAITGTPGNTLINDQPYTVYAANAGGTDTFTIRLTVGDVPSIQTYYDNTGTPNTYQFIRNSGAISPINPQVTHIPAATFTVSPALPGGLTLNASTGVITGNPTQVVTGTYRITATNQFGSDFADVTFQIGEAPAGLQYNMQQVYNVGTSVGNNLPTVTGTAPITFSIAPALSAGISFNTNTGAITGTPTGPYPVQGYVVTATNQWGSVTTSVTFRVDGPPSVTYAGPYYPAISQQTQISPVVITSPAISNWSLQGQLPAGLSFSNGVISGTPTAVGTDTSFTVSATNSAGTVSVSFVLRILVPPIITYPNLVLPVNQAMTAVGATNTGGPVPSGVNVVAATELNSFSVPSFFSGLAFDASGNIYFGGGGADDVVKIDPAVGMPNYLTGNLIINPNTVDIAPNGNLYTTMVRGWMQNLQVRQVDPVNGTILNTFDDANGITFYPKDLKTDNQHFYVVDDNDRVTKLTQATPMVDVWSYQYNGALQAVTVDANGDVWAAGFRQVLKLDGATGALLQTWGVPNNNPRADGNIATARFRYIQKITTDPAGNVYLFDLDFPNNEVYLRKIDVAAGMVSTIAGGAMGAIVDGQNGAIRFEGNSIRGMTYNNGKIYFIDDASLRSVSSSANWAINPSLPANLSFDSNTGDISGTPTTLGTTTHTVTASNAVGSGTATFTVTVGAPPTISYANTPFTNTAGTALTPANYTPVVTNSPTSYSITPALANGLSFNTTTGVISGTPVQSGAATTYTVTATNSFGSNTGTLSIATNGPVRNIQYPNSNTLTFVSGTSGTSGTPTFIAIPAVSSGGWSVSPALPANLTLNANTGVISGTPTGGYSTGTYTITAANGFQPAGTVQVTITVDAAPTISYSPATVSYGTGTAITALTPTVAGSPTISYSITPNLTANTGLSFSTTTGVISGTPTQVSAATTYTVTATNFVGSNTATVSIATGTPPSSLQYPSGIIYLPVGTNIATAIAPTGGNPGTGVPSFAITAPGNPNGLSVNPQGGIVGTPTATTVGPVTYTVTATTAFGTTTGTVQIQVGNPPTISYSPATVNYTVGTAITAATPAVTGSPTINYSISPNLSTNTGLSFDPTTGVISGTPTQAQTATTYTVTATNNFGTNTGTISITTGIAPTGLAYQTGVFSLRRGTAIAPIAPVSTATGTGPVTYTATGLPAGLSINSTTGVVSGTPTTASATATYTVTATSPFGTTTATFQARIGNPPSALTYNTPNTFTENVAITALSPTFTDTASNFTVSPQLPTGLSINTTTGVISGTATLPQTATTYTVTASNVYGSTTGTLSIAVVGLPANISYGSTTITLANNVLMTPVVPSVFANPAPTSWAITPVLPATALPAGLVFNTTTGQISGTPTSGNFSGTYQVTATNSVGTSVAHTITINVTQPPAITYGSGGSFAVGTAIIAIAPTSVQGSPTITFSISPNLTANTGLSFDPTTGTISGTPTQASANTTYTITAANANGSATATLNIATGIAPTGVTYPAGVQSFRVGTAITTPVAPLTQATGTGPITYSATGLPAGMTINPTTGIIGGTPSAVVATATYTVTATGPFGSTTATVQLQTGNAPSALSYTTPNSYPENVAITALVPQVTGTVSSWSLNTSLPAGLTFNTSNGQITGTPTLPQPASVYRVYAQNVFGIDSFDITIGVTGIPRNLSYGNLQLRFATAQPIPTTTPTVSANPAVTTWSISPSLTAQTGLNFNTSTGAITGTPTVGAFVGNYQVTATNANGTSAVLNISIEITQAPVYLQYQATPVYLTPGSAANIVPTQAIGGTQPITISAPTLPSGLSINPATGVITGSLNSVMGVQSFNVVATNAYGVLTVPVQIGVGNPPSGLAYPQGVLTYPVGQQVSLQPSQLPQGTGPFTYSLQGQLPAGLTFNPANGQVTGQVLGALPTTTFTVTATSNYGSTTASFQLHTGNAPSALQYNTPNVFTVGNTIAALNPTVTGTVGSYSIQPALTAQTGLSFNTSTGVVSGVPTTAGSATLYTVTATNVFGSTTATLSIEVQGPPTNLVYPNSGSYTLPVNTTVTGVTPTVSANPGVMYSFTPVAPATALPNGMQFSTVNGQFYGAPVTAGGPFSYLVTATNANGSTTATVTFTIVSAPTNLQYASPVYVTQNAVMTPLQPQVIGQVTQWSYLPSALPAGVQFSNGVFSGTPTQAQNLSPITVTAANLYGSATATFQLAVGSAPSGLVYPGNQLNLLVNGPQVSVSPTTPATGTGNITYSATGLPGGMTINPTTGVISGTPTTTQPLGPVVVTATSNFGTTTATIQLQAGRKPSNLQYGGPYILPETQAISNIVPSYTDTVGVFSVAPALPQGLVLNATTGVISGAPTAAPGAQQSYRIYAANIFGMDSTDVQIQVVGAPRSLQYNPNSYMLPINQAVSGVLPTVSAFPAATFTVSPALPAGLQINPATGAITGTPTVAANLSAYQVTATNAYGSVTTTVSIGVAAAPTALQYQGPVYITTGTAANTAVPTVTGTVSSWSIQPQLPAGLSLNSQGQVVGTTNVVSPLTTYTVTAANSYGSTTAPLLVVTGNAPAPLSYTVANPNIATGSTVALNPTGGTGTGTTTWSIQPQLPAGLSLNSQGQIAGTTSVVSPLTTYTVMATNPFGSTTGTVSFATGNAATAPQVSTTTVNATAGQPMTPVVPTAVSGVSYSISPAVANGFQFNPTTGALSGVPTQAGTYVFNLTATNSFGTSAATQITVVVGNAPAPLSYTVANPNIATGSTVALNPTGGTGTGTTTWSIQPQLPAGLSLNSQGQIAGTTNVVSPLTTYTVTATNNNGSVTTQVSFATGNRPAGLSYATVAPLVSGQSITPITPVIATPGTGGLTYSVQPSLPQGLTFNTATGVISGTPTSALAATSFTVTASNAFGSTSTQVSLTVQSAPTALQYNLPGNTLTVGTPAGPFGPSVNAQPAPTYTISPAPPAGMAFNPATGVLSGTPATPTGLITYTVTASNGAGSTSTTFSFRVVAIAPSGLVYTPASVSALNGVAITNMIPTAQGGAISGWSIAPALPAGLSINPQTGVIGGVLNANVQGTVNYTVTATNSGGQTTASVTINYTIPTVMGSLQVPQTVVYGSQPWTVINPASNNPAAMSWSSSNTGVARFNGNQMLITGVGTATITVSQPAQGNYLAGATTATLVVTPAPLTIRVIDTFRCINTANPRFGYEATGFVLGEDRRVLTAVPQFTTTAQTSSVAGTYPVTASGAQAANYTISYVGGTLTVNNPEFKNSRMPLIDALVDEYTSIPVRIKGTDYLWSPANLTRNPREAVAQVKVDKETEFTVRITERTGCITTDTVLVRAFYKPDVFVPSLFSPNGDGINDQLQINPVAIGKLYYFRVFNQYGRLLFETRDLNGRWDGSFQGKLQPLGTYSWILMGVDKYGKTITASGSTTLVR